MKMPSKSWGAWALALGLTGFAAGFFGPIALNPDANQGPLLGIFITGPGGAIGGAILGALFHGLQVGAAARARALVSACAALALLTLFFCLPEPKVLGYVIDAEVETCSAPLEHANEALARWDAEVARVTWAAPSPNWKQTATAELARAKGVVLTMRVARRAAIQQHRKPWDAGRKTASPWVSVGASERYYATERGTSCGSYLGSERSLYSPFTYSAGPSQPASVWPPTTPASFLSLMQLGAVPAEYRTLLHE